MELIQEGDNLVDIWDTYSIHHVTMTGTSGTLGGQEAMHAPCLESMGLQQTVRFNNALQGEGGAGEVANYSDNFCIMFRDFDSGCKAQAVLIPIVRRL